MKIVRSVHQMQALACELRQKGMSIGFVPTMGALHEGHLVLARRAKNENDVAVMSIFVNPTQFGPKEDFARYPRALKRDSRMAKNSGIDILFAPTAPDIYPEDYATYVNVERLTEGLCGSSRPGHFRGVATIVLKLFNITTPTRTYFGQKDAQQALVIRRMIRDLNLPVEMIIAPTVRESDGLAMSSRNAYLTTRQRHDAPVLYTALQTARRAIAGGERDPRKIVAHIRALISDSSAARIDYIQIVDTRTIHPVKRIAGEVLIALAVFFGKTRLIDNIIIKV